MRTERIDSLTVEVMAGYERVALLLLLEAEHAWTRAELEREIAGSRGSRGEVSCAIDALHACGLANISGDLVHPSRAARAMDELMAVCI